MEHLQLGHGSGGGSVLLQLLEVILNVLDRLLGTANARLVAKGAMAVVVRHHKRIGGPGLVPVQLFHRSRHTHTAMAVGTETSTAPQNSRL